MFAAVTSYVTTLAVLVMCATWVLFWGGMTAVIFARHSPVRSRSLIWGLAGPIGPVVALIVVVSKARSA